MVNVFLLGPALASAGVEFLEIAADYVGRNITVHSFKARTEADLSKFKEFTAQHKITVVEGSSRVATPEEIKKHDEIAW